MKAIRKRKEIIVAYKGYHAVQVPWKSDYGNEYALYIYNPQGKLKLHAGYGSKCRKRKELRLELMNYVNVMREFLFKVSQEEK